MAKDEDMKNKMMALFGILLLVFSLGLWGGAPAWFNPWTLIGLFFLLNGIGPMMMK